MTIAIAFVAATLGGIPAAPEPPGPDRDQGYEAKYPYCNSYSCDQRAKRRAVQKRHKAIVRWRAHMRKVVAPFNSKLDRIATCESGQRWNISTGNGFYGGLQFTVQTWQAAGGEGMPHWASELEQKFRAVIVHKWSGTWRDWPVCGYR